MGNLLEKGAAWLNGRRHAHLTSLVEYRRGDATVTLAATVGRTLFEQVDSSGIVQQVESRDYLVRSADLVIATALGPEQVIPQPGDEIRELHGVDTLRYEVTAPGSEPCWRYSDPQRNALRIHTKFVGAVPEPET